VSRDNPTTETELPIYWFVLLEQAIDRSDSEAAARARRELDRLGVRVTYRRRPRPKSGGPSNAA
jgi:hypothetical protein